MEGLQERIALALKALAKLHELAARQEITEVERDALIKRFEFSFELLWKCAKSYLYEEEGIDAASPKKVIRASREVGLLDEEETRQALLMVDDRNLTTHTTDEEFADDLARRIGTYDQLLSRWLVRIQEQLKEEK